MLRAVTHIHTRHSWDGIIKPRELVARLKQREVRLALVTDHDTFAGSQEVAAIARREYKNLMVPLAAEVRTDFGDVIVVLDGPSTPPVDTLKKWNTPSKWSENCEASFGSHTPSRARYNSDGDEQSNGE